MGVVCSAAQHRIQTFLIEALAPIDVVLGLGEPLGGLGEVPLIDIAQGHDILAGDRVEMGQPTDNNLAFCPRRATMT